MKKKTQKCGEEDEEVPAIEVEIAIENLILISIDC